MSQRIKKCSVDGCNKPKKSRSWCGKHYMRWLTHGDPLTENRTPPDPGRGCYIQGCGGKHKARGMCEKHYCRWKTHGDPLKIVNRSAMPVPDEEERFWSKVIVNDSDQCWEWVGTKDKDGYGLFTLSRKNQKAKKSRSYRSHRYSLEIQLGRDIVSGMIVCHYCDNPSCVNPSHLYEGTPQSNMTDAVSRNRLHKGERVGLSRRKLTEAQVIEMREKRSAGFSLQDLADRYGVGLSTVGRIVSGSGWTHAPGPITPLRTRYADRIVVGGKRIRLENS